MKVNCPAAVPHYSTSTSHSYASFRCATLVVSCNSDSFCYVYMYLEKFAHSTSIYSHLDYCNSVNYKILFDIKLKPLKYILNTHYNAVVIDHRSKEAIITLDACEIPKSFSKLTWLNNEKGINSLGQQWQKIYLLRRQQGSLHRNIPYTFSSFACESIANLSKLHLFRQSVEATV